MIRWKLTRQQEHLALADGDFAEMSALDRHGFEAFLGRDSLADRSVFDNLEGHLALVLVEPFLRSMKGISSGPRAPRIALFLPTPKTSRENRT